MVVTHTIPIIISSLNNMVILALGQGCSGGLIIGREMKTVVRTILSEFPHYFCNGDTLDT